MNKVVKIPIPRVTAKPLTGPEPKKNNIAAEIICDVKNLKKSELIKIKFALN